MTENEKRQKKISLLYTGLWKYCRHPNYFGEYLTWYGLSLLGVGAGETWVLVGPTILFLTMLASVNMIGKRMTEKEGGRREAYRQYQRATCAMFLMPSFGKVDSEYWKEKIEK